MAPARRRRLALVTGLMLSVVPLVELSSGAAAGDSTASAEGQFAPNTEITSATIRRAVNRARFEFTGSGGVPPLTFHCRMDQREWRSCASPKTYRNLSDGRHVFKVRAVDQDDVQDATPARRRFRV